MRRSSYLPIHATVCSWDGPKGVDQTEGYRAATAEATGWRSA